LDKATYLKLLKGDELSLAEEHKLLQSLDPDSALQLCQLFATRARQGREELAKASEELSALRSPPLHPARVLCVYANDRVDVEAVGGRRVVGTAPELDAASLKIGDEVFLNAELALVLAKNEEIGRTGLIGTIAEVMDGTPVVRGVNDEELLANCEPEVVSTMKAGDRVLYTRGFPCVIEHLPVRTDSSFLLNEPPPISFDSIGGLGEVKGTIRGELDMHLRHADQVGAYQLKPMRGIILYGPPGNGKNMIAAAIGNHVLSLGIDARFLHVAPGALRSMWYGGSEARIRELFAAAKAAPGLVVIFFDEIDSYGARGSGIGQDIDGKVLAALLTELDGLESAPNLFCVGATNRLDLCDEALIREGRLGDRKYRIPRPGREATRQIFAKYLTETLPYASNGGAGYLMDAAVGYLHAPEGGAGLLATATLADGSQVEVQPRDVMSGALIASTIERAKHAAAHRHLEGGAGITLEDVLGSLDQALTSAARQISAPQVARQSLDFPRADEIVRMELAPERRMRRHRYLRAA